MDESREPHKMSDDPKGIWNLKRIGKQKGSQTILIKLRKMSLDSKQSLTKPERCFNCEKKENLRESPRIPNETFNIDIDIDTEIFANFSEEC